MLTISMQLLFVVYCSSVDHSIKAVHALQISLYLLLLQNLKAQMSLVWSVWLRLTCNWLELKPTLVGYPLENMVGLLMNMVI